MKKTLLLLAAVLLFVPAAVAQKPHMSVYGGQAHLATSRTSLFFSTLRYSADFSGGVAIDARSKYAYGFTFVVSHPFNDTLSLGVGVGFRGVQGLESVTWDAQSSAAADRYTPNYLIPVVARLKYSPYRFGQWTPFLALDLGGTFPLKKSAMGGLFFEPALGADCAVSRKVSLNFAVGLSWMQTKYQYNNYWYTTPETIGSAAMAVALHAGLTF